MLTHNRQAALMAYPDRLRQILNMAAAAESRTDLAHWAMIPPGPTPLWDLTRTAAAWGVAQICVKDESQRSPLGSFKVLGAPIALLRLIQRRWPETAFDRVAFWRGAYAQQLADLTVVSATDGNHGRALAAAAQSVGCRCVIVLHAQVSQEREQAIRAYGAHILRIAGNYDESVEEAARLATVHGWDLVADTASVGYEAIPRDVMQGYSTIAAELIEQTAGRPAVPAFTHVVLQGGVGGLAAGVASYLWEYHGAQRPRFVIVEPQQADCLFQSAQVGRPARASGTVDSVMAGLACGVASSLAWEFLQWCIDDFLTIPDEAAIQAMRRLARGDADVPMVAGESGAAGLAGLAALLQSREQAAAVGLDHTSRVLLINTEGATAPAVYRALTGESADAVLHRQARRLTSPALACRPCRANP